MKYTILSRDTGNPPLVKNEWETLYNMVTSVIVRILEIVDETVMKSKQWEINKKDQRK